jgi:hypothetical protein
MNFTVIVLENLKFLGSKTVLVCYRHIIDSLHEMMEFNYIFHYSFIFQNTDLYYIREYYDETVWQINKNEYNNYVE